MVYSWYVLRSRLGLAGKALDLDTFISLETSLPALALSFFVFGAVKVA